MVNSTVLKVTGAVAVLAVSVTLIVFFVGNGSTGTPSSMTTAAPKWGGAGVGVHLLEWQWTDIGFECQQFLGPKGFKFVQVSPPMHHAYRQDVNYTKPWWLRYQPIDFGSLDSRSGTLTTFTNMVNDCFRAGVDIMVDAVINHQAGNTFGTCTPLRAWSFKNGGTGASYTPCSPNPVYPAFTASDFHNYPNPKTPEPCESKTDDCKQFRIYDLSGLQDLNTDCGTIAYQYSNGAVVSCDSTYGTYTCKSRQIVIKYLQSLLCLGVRSFRIDAAMSMAPNDIWTFFDLAVAWAASVNGCAQTANYFDYGVGKTFWGGNANVWASSTKIDANFFPFVYLEVYDGHSTYAPVHYQHNFALSGSTYMTAVTDFDSAYNIWSVFRGASVSKLIAWATAYSPAGGWNNYGNGAGATDSQHTVVFTDNHDIQRSTPDYVITNWYGKDPTTGVSGYYTNAVTFMMAYPFGTPVLMSSYDFYKAGTSSGITDLGPPSDNLGNTNDIYQNINGNYVNTGCTWSGAASSASNQGITGGWICEHRWQGIANMVKWRNVIISGSWQMRNAIVGGSSTVYGWPSALTGSSTGTCTNCGALYDGYPGMGFVRDGDGNYCYSNARCTIGAVYAVNNHPSNWWYINKWFVGIPDGYYCNVATNDWSNSTDFVDSYGNPVPVCMNNKGDQNANDALYKVTGGWLTFQDGSSIKVPPQGFLALHTGAMMPTGTGPAIYAPSITYGTPASSTLAFTVSAAASYAPSVTPGLAPYKFSYTGSLPAGLTFSTANGVISGTPTTAGSTSLSVTVTDSLQKSSQPLSLTLNVAAPAPPASVTCTPSLVYDAAASVKVTCTVPAGSGAITWSVNSGTIPAGLSFSTVNGNYVLAGTTTNAVSSATISVRATNQGGYADGSFTIGVQPTNAVVTYPVASYSFTQNTAITAINVPCGSICATYSISPALPTGLSLSTTTGSISGTATVASAATIYAISTTSGLRSTVTIKVVSAPLKVCTSCSWVGTFNNWAIASGAMTLTANYQWQVNGITLAAGTQYTFKFTCVCSGVTYWYSSGVGYTPVNNVIGSTTSIGTATNNMFFTPQKSGQYTAKFYDGPAGTTSAKTFSIGPGANAAPTLTYTASSTNVVQLATTYTWTPTVSQGNSPFTFSVISGALPAGITLATSTGIISGIPSTVGTSSFAINVTDALGLTGTSSQTIVVNAPAAPASVTCTPGGVSAVQYDAGVPISIVCTVPSTTQGPVSWTAAADGPSGTSFVQSSASVSTFTLTGTSTSIAFAQTSISVTATNLGGSVQGSFTLSVVPTNAAIVYSPATQNLPVGVSVSWSNKCGAYCGSGSGYSISPALPAGLSMDATSGAITGAPTATMSSTTYTISTASDTLSTTISFSVVTAANYASCVVAGTFDGWANPASTNWCTQPVYGSMALTSAYTWVANTVFLNASQQYQVRMTCTTACSGGTQSWWGNGASYALSNSATVTTTALTNNGANMYVTPASGGTGNYRVTFNDNTKLLSFTLNNGPPVISYGAGSNTLTAQTGATGISWSPSVQWGMPSFTYSLVGTLPTGLSFATSTGVISGTAPSTAQSTTVTVTVTDSQAQATPVTVTINVLPIQPPVSVSCAVPQVAVDANKAVSIQCSVPATTSGTVTWSVSPALPAGISISSTTGLISGTSTNAQYNNVVTVSATNSGGSTTTTVTFIVSPTGAAIAYSSQSLSLKLSAAMTAFSNACGATCGAYTISPALPTGMTMSGTTGTITGTPSVSVTAVTYTVNATGTDNNVLQYSFTLTTLTSNANWCYWLGTFNGWAQNSASSMSLMSSYNWRVKGVQLSASTSYQFKFYCQVGSANTWYSSGLTYPVTNNVASTTNAIGTASGNMYFTPTTAGFYKAVFVDNTKTFTISLCSTTTAANCA